ncbi:MAG: tetratricopeptide repeat protein [Treponema sp.]|jgi:tetratricopeptide (TPR) repeat protein|nr:tetratricopeptide repeat protein [Treponema sp.]
MKTRLLSKTAFLLFSLFFLFGFFSCATQGAVQAEEYYTIGMAFFELGKFTEAEMWLNRARAADKTMVASEYNLGRIAFETGRYVEAVRLFENVLSKDPDNVMVLKAAAYSRIKNGDIEKAETLYEKVLAFIPESADDGFNYALVLYSLKKYDDCEIVLNRYPYTLEEKPPYVLLLGRAQKAMNKVEALDTYAKWITLNMDNAANPQGLFEYAQVLEGAGHYARALEQYDAVITALTKDTAELKKSKLRFEKARLLLTVDPENDEGMTIFTTSISEGFSDTEAIENLLLDERLNQNNKTAIQKVLTDLLIKAQESKPETDDDEDEEDDEEV